MHTLNLADGPIIFGRDGTIRQTTTVDPDRLAHIRAQLPRPCISID